MGAPFVDVFKINVCVGDVVEGEALGQTPLSEMSKASYGRQQETDNPTRYLNCYSQVPLFKPIFPFGLNGSPISFYHEKPFNKK